MNFYDLKAANYNRCIKSFHPIEEWSETDWATAFGGECGEALNLIKKRRRYNTSGIQYAHPNAPTVDDVVDELADAVIYADLLCTRMGASLEEGIRRKFNEVSKRVGSSIILP